MEWESWYSLKEFSRQYEEPSDSNKFFSLRGNLEVVDVIIFFWVFSYWFRIVLVAYGWHYLVGTGLGGGKFTGFLIPFLKCLFFFSTFLN